MPAVRRSVARTRLRGADELRAYHFDAMKVAALLAAEGRALGVDHRLATICDVTLDANGGIAGVVTREIGTLQADLYVDCTGMRAALIGKALG